MHETFLLLTIRAMKICTRVPYQLEWCKNDANVYMAVLHATRRVTASQRVPQRMDPLTSHCACEPQGGRLRTARWRGLSARQLLTVLVANGVRTRGENQTAHFVGGNFVQLLKYRQ